jgi:hypothetical protein
MAIKLIIHLFLKTEISKISQQIWILYQHYADNTFNYI